MLTGHHYLITGDVRDASTGLPIDQADVLFVEGRSVDASIESANMNNAGQSTSEGKIDAGLSLKCCRHCYGPSFMWNTEPRQVLVRIVKPGYGDKGLFFKGKQIVREGTTIGSMSEQSCFCVERYNTLHVAVTDQKYDARRALCLLPAAKAGPATRR